MAKIKVSKEVATALESLSHWSKDEMIEYHAEDSWSSPHRLPLNTLSLGDFTKAIFLGYEVDEPFDVSGLAEDTDKKIAEVLNHFNAIKDAEMFTYSDGVGDGMKITLSMLGIKVKGIN